MYSGTLGKWKMVQTQSPPTPADINVEEKQGYELAFICTYNETGDPPEFFAYYKYRGGRHPNATR